MDRAARLRVQWSDFGRRMAPRAGVAGRPRAIVVLLLGVTVSALPSVRARAESLRSASRPESAPREATVQRGEWVDMDFTLEFIPAAVPGAPGAPAAFVAAGDSAVRSGNAGNAGLLRGGHVAADLHEDAEPLESGTPARAFELRAGLQLIARDASFANQLGQMPELDLYPTPTLRLQLSWYPAARLTTGIVSNLGLQLYGAMMWPVVAEGKFGSFRTVHSEYGAAARVRIPVGRHELGLLAGYGVQSLRVTRSDDPSAGSNVPSIAYHSVRLGADARFELGEVLALGVGGAALPLVGLGEFASETWFPRASGLGLQAELTAAYALFGDVDVELSIGLRRYAMSLRPTQTDAIVRRSALMPTRFSDRYLHAMLSVNWRL